MVKGFSMKLVPAMSKVKLPIAVGASVTGATCTSAVEVDPSLSV